jgi:chemotaxis protein MotB
MATFADLMSLLMCFFVLLLSFSEMDVLKFKQLAGSMREAFGVQTLVTVGEIPKGTSIIAQEFSPGRPVPTPLNEVRQFTTDTQKQNLDVRTQTGKSDYLDLEVGEIQVLLQQMELQEQLDQMMQEEARQDALALAMVLEQEIGEGSVEVEAKERKVIIRVKEKGSFDSGSADLNASFIPVISKIRDVLINISGAVSIEGHTDSIPITNGEFQSNWGLSSARALSVAQELFVDGRIEQSRYQVVGYGDGRPLAPNDTRDNRALNRRVEIVVQKGKDEELLKKLPATPGGSSLDLIELEPSEIF